jgi:hypothetical protein
MQKIQMAAILKWRIFRCYVGVAPSRTNQGCQIALVKNTKTWESVPIDHKIYQMAIKYTRLL